MAFIYNLTTDQGSTVTLEITVVDSLFMDYDVSDWNVRATIRDKQPSVVVIAQFVSWIVGNKVYIKLPASISELLTKRRYYFDVELYKTATSSSSGDSSSSNDSSSSSSSGDSSSSSSSSDSSSSSSSGEDSSSSSSS